MKVIGPPKRQLYWFKENVQNRSFSMACRWTVYHWVSSPNKGPTNQKMESFKTREKAKSTILETISVTKNESQICQAISGRYRRGAKRWMMTTILRKQRILKRITSNKSNNSVRRFNIPYLSNHHQWPWKHQSPFYIMCRGS